MQEGERIESYGKGHRDVEALRRLRRMAGGGGAHREHRALQPDAHAVPSIDGRDYGARFEIIGGFPEYGDVRQAYSSRFGSLADSSSIRMDFMGLHDMESGIVYQPARGAYRLYGRDSWLGGELCNNAEEPISKAEEAVRKLLAERFEDPARKAEARAAALPLDEDHPELIEDDLRRRYVETGGFVYPAEGHERGFEANRGVGWVFTLMDCLLDPRAAAEAMLKGYWTEKLPAIGRRILLAERWEDAVERVGGRIAEEAVESRAMHKALSAVAAKRVKLVFRLDDGSEEQLGIDRNILAHKVAFRQTLELSSFEFAGSVPDAARKTLTLSDGHRRLACDLDMDRFFAIRFRVKDIWKRRGC